MGAFGKLAPALFPGGLWHLGAALRGGGAGGTGPDEWAAFQGGKSVEKRQKGQRPVAVRCPQPEDPQDRKCPSTQEGCVRSPCGAPHPEMQSWLGVCYGRNGDWPGDVSGPASAALPRGHLAWAAPMQGVTAARECPSGWGPASGRPASCLSAMASLDFILGSSYWMLWGCPPLCPGPRPGLVCVLGLPQTSYPNHTRWKRLQKMGQEILRFM